MPSVKKVYTVEESVIVKNEIGTSKRGICGCGSWLKHWEKVSDELVICCSVEDCFELAEHGAHVLRPYAKNEAYKRKSYIIPMCPTHNGQHGKELRVRIGTTFVWANVNETCGDSDDTSDLTF